MGHHGPKWVGDSKYSYFSSCRNFIGTSQHNSRHLICKFSNWQIVVLLCVRYSVDRGPWWCCLRRATGCKDLDGLHGPQNIARTRCIDESLLTGPISRKSHLRRLRDTYKPEDERLNPWKFSEVFWSLVVWRIWGYSFQSERKVAPSCIPYLQRGGMLWGLFWFWKQHVLHFRMLLWPMY